MLRRLLSILLFGATLLPLIAPMLSTGAMAQSTLPACCRRGGKHHCSMSAEQRALMMGQQKDGASKAVRVTAPLEECPYRQHSLVAVHLHVFTSGATATHSVCMLQEPSAAAQAECLRRISFDRSRQKRGPPSLLS
jgi:hypothetical protein